MKQKGSGKIDLRGADRKLQPEAGVQRIELHGCSKVHDNGDYCEHLSLKRSFLEDRPCPLGIDITYRGTQWV